MKDGLEGEVNHPKLEDVVCKHKRCGKFGKRYYCYFSVYDKCQIYQKWDLVVELYKRKALQRAYLKEKKKNDSL